jgi:hypothetical protein
MHGAKVKISDKLLASPEGIYSVEAFINILAYCQEYSVVTIAWDHKHNVLADSLNR